MRRLTDAPEDRPENAANEKAILPAPMPEPKNVVPSIGFQWSQISTCHT